MAEKEKLQPKSISLLDEIRNFRIQVDILSYQNVMSKYLVVLHLQYFEYWGRVMAVIASIRVHRNKKE